MRAADFMRSILDAIEGVKQSQAAPPTVVININNGEAKVSTAHEEPVDDDTGVFVPPLQQKIELLKKSSGVKSVYDDAAGDDEPLDV